MNRVARAKLYDEHHAEHDKVRENLCASQASQIGFFLVIKTQQGSGYCS
jgi:hypothetical protein